VYCRFRHQLLEIIKAKPLRPSLSSSILPLPNHASGKPWQGTHHPRFPKNNNSGDDKMRSWAWSAAGMVLPSTVNILYTNSDLRFAAALRYRVCSSSISNTMRP